MSFQLSLRFIAASICLLVVGTLSAADKKSLLTEKEIADGWILLFDGETTFGWAGKAEVKDGVLNIVAKDTVTFGVPLPPGEFLCEVENCRVNAGKGFKISYTAPDGGFTTVQATRTKTGTKVETVVKDANSDKNVSRGTLDGPSVPALWTVSLEGQSNGGGRVKSVKFRPAKPEQLFNGKDLTGWKVFKDEKRAKSEWSVTAAGELALKNGPGDLQTEKQFDDFLLQLECKTNGTALNSGVFFRCIADQYQNGYEMQIQNAFKENDRTKPADFGTGAIYRRIAARKVVSNDKEWFSMTLVAHGPHIATWVNGYQVVNWKDERAPNDNPRQGLKTGKGHLSLQGHDPTTDILFRNIRVAEVK